MNWKRSIKKWALLYCCLLAHCSWGQQLPERSILGGQDFMLNPAMTASTEGLQIGAIFRQQWLGFSGAPSTTNLTLEIPLDEQRMGWGLWLEQDDQAGLQRYQLGGSYRYTIRPNWWEKDRLSWGLYGQMTWARLNGNDFIVKEEEDPLLLEGQGQALATNAGFGFLYTTNYQPDLFESAVYFGFAIQQAIPGTIEFLDEVPFSPFKQVRHFNAHLGAAFHNDFGQIEPSLWLHFLRGNLSQLDFNLKMNLQDLWRVGFRFSSNSLFVIRMGYRLSNVGGFDHELWIGAATHFALHALRASLPPSLELILTYQFE
ncbi:MAG: PorP/SprF family type IX secretion system membrane protein [Bacteroidota bacterium]